MTLRNILHARDTKAA
jgi:hypothetical protein